MSFHFNPTSQFLNSTKDIVVILNYANQEDVAGKADNRDMFLRLSIVLLVTKLQVFIERVLNEYIYKCQNSNKTNNSFPVHLRLNSIKYKLVQTDIPKKLESADQFSIAKIKEIETDLNLISNLINDTASESSSLQIKTKFPLGKTGANELVDLLSQINGENIFDVNSMDINKLNEILGRRNSIIHEDSNQQLTEQKIIEYKTYLESLASSIDDYLFQKL